MKVNLVGYAFGSLTTSPLPAPQKDCGLEIPIEHFRPSPADVNEAQLTASPVGTIP
jgi:hypothetical protein